MTEQVITEFVKVSLKNPTKGSINQTIQNPYSLVLNYPCSDTRDCTPYVLTLSKGVYRLECWGSIGGGWGTSNSSVTSTPGLGGYTAGTLYIPQPAGLPEEYLCFGS